MLPILVFLVLLAIYQNSFSKGRFTCKNFLLNAYLYIFLSFLITAISVQIYDYYQVPSLMDIYRNSGFTVLAILIMMLGLLILVMSWSPQKVFQKHFLWVLWVALIGYTLYPLFQKSPQIYEQGSLLTFMMMAVLTGITFMYPNKVKLSWGSTLFTFLIGLILIRIIHIFIPFSSSMHYWLSYISLVLFSFFMLWDTKLLMTKAKKCVQADYINDSMGVFLDGLNIFTNIFAIQSN
jgi:FtsH-binding integral membrane protein